MKNKKFKYVLLMIFCSSFFLFSKNDCAQKVNASSYFFKKPLDSFLPDGKDAAMRDGPLFFLRAGEINEFDTNKADEKNHWKKIPKENENELIINNFPLQFGLVKKVKGVKGENLNFTIIEKKYNKILDAYNQIVENAARQSKQNLKDAYDEFMNGANNQIFSEQGLIDAVQKTNKFCTSFIGFFDYNEQNDNSNKNKTAIHVFLTTLLKRKGGYGTIFLLEVLGKNFIENTDNAFVFLDSNRKAALWYKKFGGEGAVRGDITISNKKKFLDSFAGKKIIINNPHMRYFSQFLNENNKELGKNKTIIDKVYSKKMLKLLGKISWFNPNNQYYNQKKFPQKFPFEDGFDIFDYGVMINNRMSTFPSYITYDEFIKDE